MNASESIGLSGLLVSQRLIDMVGQNISNASTPGYHRQVASLVALGSGVDVGQGVDIGSVNRLFNQSLENSLTQNTFATGDISAQLDTLNQIEAQLNPTDGSISNLIDNFFNQVEQLSGQPDDTTQREVLVSKASDLAGKLNDVYAQIQSLHEGAGNRIASDVASVNSLTAKIADLNNAIQRVTIQGGNPNDLSDQRDQLVKNLAQLIDVRVVPQDFGSENVLAGGAPLVLGAQNVNLEVGEDANGNTILQTKGLPVSVQVSGGELHGLLTLDNTAIGAVSGQLANLANSLVKNIDAISATGQSLTPRTIEHGVRGVTKVNFPLAKAGMAFPPQAGSVYVTMTNQATGAKTLSKVDIDPNTQSLQDVAAAFSAVSNLQGIVDPQSGTMTLVAAPGYSFDFSGQIPATPQTSAVTGTSIPQFGGTYIGSQNDQFTYKVVGTGDIGVSPNLTLQARNGSGALVGTWNIGQGYEPGSPLDALQGVSVSLSAGTVNDGDSFTGLAIANPDTAGLLPALGLGTMFQGGIGSLQVRGDLLDNPDLLAGSTSGLSGDGSNFLRMASLRDQPLLEGGKTYDEYYATMVAGVGGQVANLQDQQNAQQVLGQSLQAQQQSLSGVDPNEELTNLLQYQRSFQLSAKFLSIVNDTLGTLMQVGQ